MRGFCRGGVWKGLCFLKFAPPLAAKTPPCLSSLPTLWTFLVSFHDSPFPLAPQILVFPRFFPWLFFFSKHFLGSTSTRLGGMFILMWITPKFLSPNPACLWVAGPEFQLPIGTSAWITLCLPASSFHSELLHSEICWTKPRGGVKEDGTPSSKNLFCTQKKVESRRL